MSYNWGRIRNRLRKGKRGTSTYYGYGSRAIYRPIYNKHKRTTPEWGALRKFQRRLNIAISDFLDIGVYGFEDKEDFENKEEDDDSNLAVYDPWFRETIEDAKEDEDKDKEDEDDDSYRRNLYRR
jgi:hypothetical protein